ncbi:MAG: hypothetical protein RL661_1280 [Pseudomonadota bacterium]
MRELRTRLNIGLGLILTLGFGIQWGLRNYLTPLIAEEQMMTRLNHDIEALQNAISFDADGNLAIDIAKQLPVYRQRFSGHYFVVESKGERRFSPSIGEESVHMTSMLPGQEQQGHTMGPHQQPLLVLGKGITVQGHPVSISVGEDLSDLDHDVTEVGNLFLLLNGVTIGLALIIQWMFVSRALKPFTQLSHELFMLGRGGRAVATVTDLPKPDEVKRLIALVQRRLERSRNAIGNLAHGIKTPLAMLFRLAQAPALAENPELSQDITRYAESIRQLIESELRRARLAGSGHVTQTLNPFQALSGLVKMVRTIHAEKPLDFTVQASNEPVAFDLQDFMELMGNLLDNAAKWAEEQIAVHVQQKDGDLYVTVEDDGIGCTEEQMQGLTQRGVRLDETREGHGLGLSIVRDLVDQYHGALTLSRSVDLGGLRVAAILKMDPR